jgi:mRNA interferase MazF
MKQIFYAPQRGDIVRVSSPAPSGREQRESRLFLVLSPQAYNSRVGLALLCPITAHIKGYPFEALIPEGLPVKGAVMADQAESIDWRSRRAELICALPAAVVEEALGKLRALFE